MGVPVYVLKARPSEVPGGHPAGSQDAAPARKEHYKRNTEGLSNNIMYLKVNNNLYCLHAMNKYNEMECTVT